MKFAIVYAAAPALALCAFAGHAGAQATAPSGALSPAAPANAAPTSPGQNSATPKAPGQADQQPAAAGQQTGVPQAPAATQSTPSNSSMPSPDTSGARPSTPPPNPADLGAPPASQGEAPTNPVPQPLIQNAPGAPVGAPGTTSAQGALPVVPPTGGPVVSLEEAIKRAKTVDHNYNSAVVDSGTANAQKTIARADLLPNVDYHNQFIYTEPQRPYNRSSAALAGTPAPIFIANNTVHEYVTQGVVTETVGFARFATLQKAYADAAAAKAKLEIARRGLVATVVGAYYGLLSAQEKYTIAVQALDEANRFLTVSQQLEAGGEAARADVLKAQLTQQQRDRDLRDAELAAIKARLDLGVLLFPDPTTPYSLATDLFHPPALSSREDMAAAIKNASPDVKAAMAELRASEFGVRASRAAYFPDLSLAYNYGIDSDHLAVHEPDGIRNLGYAATATLDIPVWDWFATHAKVKQSELQRDLAKVDLTAAQRRTIAAFQEFYGEAEVASSQMASLNRSVADATEALRLTTDKYRAGEGAVLEVVDAQNTLVTAESARADGLVRYYTSLANLQTMTGNLP